MTSTTLKTQNLFTTIYMYHHVNESKSLTALKHFLIWFSLLFMGSISIILLKANDLKIPQRQAIITINVKDKINICTPGEKDQ